MSNSLSENVYEFEVTNLMTCESNSMYFRTWGLDQEVIDYLNEMDIFPKMVVRPEPLEIFDDICFEAYSQTNHYVYLEMTEAEALPFLMRFNLQG